MVATRTGRPLEGAHFFQQLRDVVRDHIEVYGVLTNCVLPPWIQLTSDLFTGSNPNTDTKEGHKAPRTEIHR